MTLTTRQLELSRSYFEREARFGCRVIFQWTPSNRWPDGCGMKAPYHPPDCLVCHDRPIFEGAAFPTEAAAQAYDLDKMLDAEIFKTWKAAERWLRGES